MRSHGCERFFTDTVSGAKTARPGLDEILKEARAKDVIVIWKLDRLGRSLKHLVELVADLMAAESVTELILGRPHPLKGDHAGEFALDLDGGKRLVFESANDPVPLKKDKSIDWSKVTSIRIVFIGDYHD